MTSVPAPYGTVTLPDGRTLACPRWAPAPDVVERRLRDLAGRYFVVRTAGNDGLGELWRCKSCGGRHDYLTNNCVERPFAGLDQALYLMFRQCGDLAAVRSLDPAQTARRDAGMAIARQVIDTLPDLAERHPEMARQRARANELTAFDLEVGGVAVGRAEQIPKTLAQRLLDRINSRRPIDGRIHIDGLEA